MYRSNRCQLLRYVFAWAPMSFLRGHYGQTTNECLFKQKKYECTGTVAPLFTRMVSIMIVNYVLYELWTLVHLFCLLSNQYFYHSRVELTWYVPLFQQLFQNWEMLKKASINNGLFPNPEHNLPVPSFFQHFLILFMPPTINSNNLNFLF